MSGEVPDETTPSSEAEDISLEELIRVFLQKHPHGLYEFRLQKLVYLAELLSLAKRGERITNTEYVPYMYGCYSEELSNTLEDLEGSLPTMPEMKRGKIVTKYQSDGEEIKVDSEIEDIVESVVEATSGIGSEDLGKWSKKTDLYSKSEYAETMKFKNYIDNSNFNLREDIIKLGESMEDHINN
ncbi:type II toxin-antitoxin system antitoxin SocA domain-containing protein [Halovivax limisalsi]|uniref:type II toxin-antitoxin system antitoxin SocA domain-containing protein n=1 Tax=Halovivax limisalsi TaxID=1453760 RepID=UPI001FFCC9A1|nr:type II toxin-antitoxin system antitoxin SocA domain-containing protein [Halovivax limisalsi]